MSPETVAALAQTGQRLYGARVVATHSIGTPLVWFATDDYSTTTTIEWAEVYQGYVFTEARGAFSQSATGIASVSGFNAISVGLGQTVVVDSAGNLSVSATGTEGAISIWNKGSRSWRTGIASAGPLQAFSQLGKDSQVVIAPRLQLFLMIAPAGLRPGQPLTRSTGPGVLIDLAGVSARTVTYDISVGWGPTGEPWLTTIAANADLTPLLIIDPSP